MRPTSNTACKLDKHFLWEHALNFLYLTAFTLRASLDHFWPQVGISAFTFWASVDHLRTLGAVELPKIGRKYAMVMGACLQGMSMFLYFKVDSIAGSVGFNALEWVQTFWQSGSTRLTFLVQVYHADRI